MVRLFLIVEKYHHDVTLTSLCQKLWVNPYTLHIFVNCPLLEEKYYWLIYDHHIYIPWLISCLLLPTLERKCSELSELYVKTLRKVLYLMSQQVYVTTYITLDFTEKNYFADFVVDFVVVV